MNLPCETAIERGHRHRQVLALSACAQPRGDKSAFLAGAGYTLDNVDQLLHDLRTQILPLDAAPLESGKFGRYYEIRGTLKGPNGAIRAVRTIWITEHLSAITKFVTLIPDKRRT